MIHTNYHNIFDKLQTVQIISTFQLCVFSKATLLKYELLPLNTIIADPYSAKCHRVFIVKKVANIIYSACGSSLIRQEGRPPVLPWLESAGVVTYKGHLFAVSLMESKKDLKNIDM